MNAVNLVDSIIDDGSNIDEILGNKANILLIFNQFEIIPIDKLGQIFFVLINKFQEHISEYTSDEILHIFNQIISKSDLLSNQSFSFAISNFTEFLSLCFYIPLDNVIQFTNLLIGQTFAESEQEFQVINENTKYLSVLMISALIKNLTMTGLNDLILHYRNMLFRLLVPVMQQNDTNWAKIVCDTVVDIIENTFDLIEDTFEYFLQAISFIRESGNFVLWDIMWTSLTFADEDLIKSILDFSINIFHELGTEEFNKSIFNFIANNVQYINFQSYINENEDITLLTLFLQHIISLDSLDDYDDSLISKIVKYASLNDKEFHVLLEFINETINAETPSEIQISACFTIFSEILEEQGYKFLSFPIEDTPEHGGTQSQQNATDTLLPLDNLSFINQIMQPFSQNQGDVNKRFCVTTVGHRENFFVNLVLTFVMENKEELLSDILLTTNIDCLIQSFAYFKQYLNPDVITELFSFCFSNLCQIEDETHFSVFYKLLTDLVPYCKVIPLGNLLPDINENNIEVLIAFLKHFYYGLDDQKIEEIIQAFLPLTEINDDATLSFYKLISVIYIQKPNYIHCFQVFSELTQSILASLPQQEPNFISTFLQTMIETLCDAHTLPEFDLSPIDGLFSEEQTEVFKPILENVKKLQFLYAHMNSSTINECNTKRYLLFKENPLLYLEVLISFPEFYSPAFMINANETWASFSFLTQVGQLEMVSSFFKAMIENGDDYCIKFAFNYFMQIPINSNTHCVRAALILLPSLLKCQSLPQDKLHNIFELFVHLLNPH